MKHKHKKPVDQNIDYSLQRSCLGRLVSAITFIIIIVLSGLWIFAFFLLRDIYVAKFIPEEILNNALCILFFGGLIFAMVLGGIVGNTLRRSFWNLLLRYNRRIDQTKSNK